ncbi:hypothetical protein QJS66_02500 [Kocuria rhizophila]|nr:hypothetical protein QJS66_02500 [Kocuria rhizophila]
MYATERDGRAQLHGRQRAYLSRSACSPWRPARAGARIEDAYAPGAAASLYLTIDKATAHRSTRADLHVGRRRGRWGGRSRVARAWTSPSSTPPLIRWARVRRSRRR